MLSKKERVGKHLFPLLFKKSKEYRSEHLSLKVSNFKDLSSGSLSTKEKESISLTDIEQEKLFAFVVSKKVAKNAVTRNKLKRRGRAMIRKHSKKVKKGFGYIFFFHKGVEKLNFSQTEDEIVSLLEKSDSII